MCWSEQFNKHSGLVLKIAATQPRGELPYNIITDGDARQNVQKQPLKVTTLGVAPANYIP